MKRSINAYALCILIIALNSCSSAREQADIIFYNGTVLTVDSEMTETQALAVKDGKIMALGSNEEILKHKDNSTELVDLEGHTLMPGFVETHSHPVLKMLVDNFIIDIRPVFYTDGKKVMSIINDAIRKAKPGEYLIFFGWDPLLQKGLKNPTIQELDRMAPNNPLIIWGNSVHVAFANTNAFKLAGIDKNTPNPSGAAGGTFDHYKNGELNGRVDQGAPIEMLLHPFLRSKISDPDTAALYMSKAWKLNASDGITTVTDSVMYGEFYKIYKKVIDKYPAIRVRGYALDFNNWKPFEGNDMLKVNGGKLFIDGSPWTGTITMTIPYQVNNTTTQIMDTPAGYMQKPYVTKKELQDFVDACLKSKRSAQIHVEGDEAIQMALDAIENGLKKYPWNDHRISLEHAPMMRDDQLARAKRLGVPVTFLMAHVKYWGDIIPTLVGEQRGQRWCPVGSAKKYDVNFAFHFDGPTSPNRPLEILETAVTRRTVHGKVLGPEQRITIDDAIKGYTINAAKQLFMDKEVGSLEVGKLADMIILSDDPRKVPIKKVPEIKVLKTYVNGKKIY